MEKINYLKEKEEDSKVVKGKDWWDVSTAN